MTGHIQRNTHRTFQKLGIPKPEKAFVSYPSPTLLFHKMESIQKQAMHALLGKNLISRDKFDMGRVELTDAGRNIFSALQLQSGFEEQLGDFLGVDFAGVEELGNIDLRRRSGLRRPI